MAEDDVRTFHWADYLIFVLVLAISTAIGIFYCILDWRKSSVKEFLLGGQRLGAFPVAMSIKASFLSAVSVLGIPAEVYFYGPTYAYLLIGYLISYTMTAHVFVPLFYRLKLTSGYEYIEMRYKSKPVRSIASLIFILMTILYMAVALYAPSMAFSQVTGLSLWLTLIGTGVVCTIYTALGGMKAVVWTDTFQMIVIAVGLIALLVKGSMDAGGFGHACQIAMDHGRVDFTRFDPHPHVRTTFWTQSLGGAVLVLGVLSANQTMIQRYLSVNSPRQAKKALYYAQIIGFVYMFLLIVLGMVMYGYYHGCDPLALRQIKKADQMLPLFMMKVLGDYHGLPGLFTACIFSAALSTVSSGVNALAAVVLVDIIQPLHKVITDRNMSEHDSMITSKILALVFGILTIVLAIAAQYVGGLVIQVALSVLGMAGGPLLGCFLLGLLFPYANKWGAGAGLVCSLLLNLWIGLAGIVHPPRKPFLPRYTDGCPNNTFSMTSPAYAMYTNTSDWEFDSTTSAAAAAVSATQSVSAKEMDPLQDLYSVSYMWYGLIAVLVSFLIGIPISLLTGGLDQDVGPELAYRCCRGSTSDHVTEEAPAKGDTVRHTNGVRGGYEPDPKKNSALTGEEGFNTFDRHGAYVNPSYETARL